MIRVALLSRWHVHANDYARQASNHPEIAIAAVWDENPARGQAWANELSVPFFADLNELLSSSDIDAVIVDTPTNMHPEVIGAALQHGKHVFTEKVLATTVSECDKLLRSAADKQLQLMASLPRLTDNYFVTVEKAVNEGAIGQLTFIRSRLAHNGALPTPDRPNGWLPDYFFDQELCGGGALMDLGAHPIYLTNRLAGPAASVSASFTYFTSKEVEDHATVLVEYASGISGVIEAGFISQGSPFVLELHGTDGVLQVEDSQVRVRSRMLNPEGRLEWRTMPLLDRYPTPMEQWINAISGRAVPTITQNDIRQLTVINQAAIESNQSGKKVQL